MTNQAVAIDWDSTMYDMANDKLMDGARDALDELRMRGFQLILYSCNNAKWLRMKCEQFNVHFDRIWGESTEDHGKIVAAVYVDDRAVAFRGNWELALKDTLTLLEERPIKNYRGPRYLGNPKREAELVNNNDADYWR